MLRSETSAFGASDSVSRGGAAAGCGLRLKKAISVLLDVSDAHSDYQISRSALCHGIYSARSAIMGSIRVARRAGSQVARKATTTRSSAVAANVTASTFGTPN